MNSCMNCTSIASALSYREAERSREYCFILYVSSLVISIVIIDES